MKSWKNNIENRLDWDSYFLSIAYLSSQRSIDPTTCHGACWVASDNRMLSIGYNGPPSGSIDRLMIERFQEADFLKYGLMIHAEENALLNYKGSKSDTNNSKMYITGHPCHKCLCRMIQSGIKTIICGHVSSRCVNNEDKIISKILLNDHSDVKIMHYNDINSVELALKKTQRYIDYKK